VADYPAFLVIGAQKAATTWLHRMLRAHPGVWTPREKELHYFDEKLWNPRVDLRRHLRGDRPEDERWRRQVRHQLRLYRSRPTFAGVGWNMRYFLGRRSDEWYASLFKAGAGRVTGEVTPEYSALSDERVRHIASIMPDVRIILIVRHPVERAWSHAVMERIRKQPQMPSVAEIQEHFTSDASRRLTDYPQMLARWSDAVSPEQVFLAWFEDVHFHPRALLQSVYAFLGLGDPPAWPEGLDAPVWKGALEVMPLEHAAFLAEQYAPALDELAGRFGGHADWWRYSARHLAEGADANGELVYPFYDSPLWPAYALRQGGDPDWVPPLQSAGLADLRRAPQPRDQDAAEPSADRR
jgi:hypothetical protein